MPNARPQRRMVSMQVAETSGVDHPAHGFEGWLVRKSVSPETLGKLAELVQKGKDMTKALTKDELVEEVRKSALPEGERDFLLKAIDLSDDMNAAAALWSSLRDKQEQGDPDVPKVNDDGTPADPADAAAAGADPVAPVAPVAPAPVAPVAAAANQDLFKAVEDPAIREVLQKAFEVQQAQVNEALAKAAEERNLRLDAEAVELSKSAYSNIAMEHEVVAPALRKFAEADPATYELVKATLEKANGQLEAAGIFAEIGTSVENQSGTGQALAKATKLAEGFLAAGVSTDMPSAMAKAWKDNPSLYTDYEKESGRA